MSVFISDKDTTKLYVQFFRPKITPDLNTSARMSWAISEISKPFKNLAVVYVFRLEVLNLIIDSCSFFKQYLVLYASQPFPDQKLLVLLRGNVSLSESSTFRFVVNDMWASFFSVKEGTPSDEVLEVLAHRISPDCWKPLGRRLKIEESRLTAYDRENPLCREKAYSMLLFWKERDGFSARYQVLYDALCHDLVGLGRLAKEVCCDWKLGKMVHAQAVNVWNSHLS